MRPMGVVVRHIGSQDGLEMTPAHDEYPVQALAANRAHEPFGVSIGARCLYRGLHHLDTHRCEDGVECQRELRVPVSNQEPEPVGTVVKRRCCICGEQAQAARLVSGELAVSAPIPLLGLPSPVSASLLM